MGNGLLDFRTELNRILYKGKDIVKDIDDFWLFVKKYETVLKKTKSSKTESELYEELKSKVPLGEDEQSFFSHIDSMAKKRLHSVIVCNFKAVLLAYISFKKKEETNKVKKIKEFQENLPVFQFRDEIIDAIKTERVVIIAGDTGCGKSTQVPQYLIKAGLNKVACTQPRRIACVALCKRVAYETLNEYGAEIGYQVRFEKHKTDETKILFLTEGLLLRQISADNELSNYEIVVLDEIHERHLYGDFLLGILKCLLFQRKDFKLVLMSATININLFSGYFGDNAKVIQVPGRLYPIQVHYMPPTPDDLEVFKKKKHEKINPGPYIRILKLIENKYSRDERGDVLIFLSGISEINAIVDAIKDFNEESKKWIVLPLHSTVSINEQTKVFDYAPEGFRKCIVSTNIAETSVTIDGIRFVVDSGMVKEMSYDPVCKMQRLKEFWVSKASAEQRKGRAGRTGPGVCYRLYSESDYAALADYATPEIQLVPLDNVLLQMISMGLPDVRKFPFLEAPSQDCLENAILSLKEHGALTDNEKITPMGQMLSTLPIDIPLGKMLITGSIFHQIEPALSLAAALSVSSPYTNRAFRDMECEIARKSCESDHGDPLILLNALREWLEVKKKDRSGRDRVSSREWCKRRGFEEQRFYEIIKLRSQFKDLLKDCGLLSDEKVNTEGMSSTERTLRQGELKVLKSLKRKQLSEGSDKKKFLKPDSWEIETPETGHDMRDIDFRLSTDSSKLDNLLSGSTACTYKDLTMLKVILLSGLYPQIAIPDDFNHAKGVNEQLFHTKGKPFIFLHPMSYFGNNGKVLLLEDSDIVHAPGFSSRNPLSSRHQLLCYMSLLETNKPYLVNTMRMPAAQTLLIMSNEIHTNFDFTVIVCDSWIKLTFPVSPPIEKLLLSVVKLRKSWQELLQAKLEDGEADLAENSLSNGLISVMKSEIVYSCKRLLPADLKDMYLGPTGVDLFGNNPIESEYKMEENKKIGGIQLTSYLTFNCLKIGSDSPLTDFECSKCGLTAPLNTLERLQHISVCTPDLNSEVVEESNNSPRKPNSKLFNCPTCNKTMYLTPVEILKHKKSHLKSSDE